MKYCLNNTNSVRNKTIKNLEFYLKDNISYTKINL